MAEQLTPNFGFSYYDQYDINWHTGINNNFINLDALLLNIGAGSNFIAHTLWQQDSDSDGIPDLWSITSGGTYITGKVLQASELMGFAKKLVLTLNNSSGSTQYGGIGITGVIPPNVAVAFSAYLKSTNLNIKLRIKNGGANIDSLYATHASAERVEVAGTLGAALSTTELTVLIEIPDGVSSETVEIHLPMLNVGDKASVFCPAPGEMADFLVNDLKVYGNITIGGQLLADLDCNQKQLKKLRLEVLASPPGAQSGQLWFDSTRNVLRYYNGAEHSIVAKQTHEWVISGALSTGTEVGGVWVVPQDLKIKKVWIYCKNTGTAGTTIVDVNRNADGSIFSTANDRPQLAYDDADKKAESGTLGITTLSEGDLVKVDIDQIATGAENLSIILICE